MILGVIGALGLGSGEVISQPAALSTSIGDVLPLTAVAFWLFIGSEFVIPIAKDMKNPKRNVPLSMFLSLAIMCIIQVLMVIGFKNYTPWGELSEAASPHILYAVNMLGSFGRYWIIVVAIFAAVSTQNSIIGCVAEICCGMAKIGLLPAVFQKKNKHNAPYLVIILLGIITILIEASGLSTGAQISFLILTSSLFQMLSYMVSHFNVISLRKKMATVPRSFKSPFFPIPQIVGIVGLFYMMFNISTDPGERLKIFALYFVLLFLLIGYAVYWIKFKLKMPLFKRLPIKDVMAMENPLYYELRREKTK
jgi:amino acid transporter